MKTVVASTDCVVGLLSRKALFRLASVRCYVMKTMQMNFVSATLETMRATVPVLREITTGQMRRLAMKVNYQTVEAGAHVYREGDFGDRFFIVVAGQVHIEKQIQGTTDTRIVKDVNTGGFFGQVALVVSSKRIYTAVAKTRCLLISVDGDSFRAVFDANLDKQSVSNIRNEGVKVDVIHILRSFKGYKAFMEFLKLEHSTEGLLFWRAVDRYEDMCLRIFCISKTTGGVAQSSPRVLQNNRTRSSTDMSSSTGTQSSETVDYHMLHSIAMSIINTFIVDGAVNQINIQGNLQRKIIATFNVLSDAFYAGTSSEIPETAETLEGGEDSGYSVLFKRPKSEVFGLLRSDNYMRWKDTKEFVDFISSIHDE